jgi:Mn-dependent DtxR family transcriptional regulator
MSALWRLGSATRTKDLAANCGLVGTEVRTACARLSALGLVAERKRRLVQQFGNNKALKILSFWELTELGRRIACEL